MLCWTPEPGISFGFENHANLDQLLTLLRHGHLVQFHALLRAAAAPSTAQCVLLTGQRSAAVMLAGGFAWVFGVGRLELLCSVPPLAEAAADLS